MTTDKLLKQLGVARIALVRAEMTKDREGDPMAIFQAYGTLNAALDILCGHVDTYLFGLGVTYDATENTDAEETDALIARGLASGRACQGLQDFCTADPLGKLRD